MSEPARAGRSLRGVALVLSSVLFALAPLPAQALPSNPEAKAHLAKGTDLYKRNEFDAAVEEFRKGYALEEDPVFLYSWAQAERRRGNCAASVKLYQKFLATKPDQLAAEYARDGILQCAEKLAGEEPLPPGETETPETPEPETTTTPPGDELGGSDRPDEPEPRGDRPKWPRDALGASLVAFGIAGTGAGIGVLVASAVRNGKAPAGETYGEFDARQQQVQTLRIAGGVVLGVGVPLLVGGIVRWAILASREKKARKAEVSASFDGRSVGLVLTGRF